MNKFSIETIIGHANSTKFIAKANKFPELENLVTDIDWISTQNLITLFVREDNRFSVYHWFSEINKRYQETMSLPGVLLKEEFDYINLYVCDSQKNIITKIKLNELQLNYHECHFTEKLSPNDNLIHEIQLTYNSVDVIPVEKTILTNNEIVDEEWKSDIETESVS